MIETALKDPSSDFEGAVIYHSAFDAGANAIATRDLRGFKSSKIPVYDPLELLNNLWFID